MSSPGVHIGNLNVETTLGNEDAPVPLNDQERHFMKRMFSDFYEVPGPWKTDLKAELERDPPILGKATLGGQSIQGPMGPMGPAGPAGPQGPPGASYTHTQSPLAATWVVLHNLNTYPSVSVVDTGNTQVLPDVHYDNSNQITLTFAAATSGKAYLN